MVSKQKDELVAQRVQEGSKETEKERYLVTMAAFRRSVEMKEDKI